MRTAGKWFTTSFNYCAMRRRGSMPFTATATSLNLLLVVVLTFTAAGGFLIPHRKSVSSDADVEDGQADVDNLQLTALNDAVPMNEPPSPLVQCGSPSTLPLLGASEAQSPSWPWIVSIQAENNHLCGGTLIGHRWVLTAAVCANRLMSANYKTVVIRRHGSVESDQFSHTIPVEAVIVDDNDAGDLAMLKLAEAVTFNSGVQPVCLPRLLQAAPTGRICWTTGWSEDGLTQNLVTVVHGEMCGLHHPQHQQQQQQQQHGIHRRRDASTGSSSICTVTVDSEHPCQVESPGSAMMCFENSHWVLFGIGIGGTVDACSTEYSGARPFQSVPTRVDWIYRRMHGQ